MSTIFKKLRSKVVAIDTYIQCPVYTYTHEPKVDINGFWGIKSLVYNKDNQ